jgi:Asp-tRNA(Asn)/Glu-tRNA(Gln) amidotransferase A subunit family amidase
MTAHHHLLQQIDAACDRIDARDAEIQALLPEPGRRARLLEDASRLPADAGPLRGVLLGVKDVFRVDGFPTRAGSALPPELFDGPEAAAVTRLRMAGALVLGKTVTTEFAYFAPGPTRNPHNLDHTPGGSSSGSAAAVAAGYCPLALGTQTVGSVIRPAAFCGIVGFKPSYGRVPTEGVIPYAPSLDHVGLLGESVEQVAAAAALLCDGWTPVEPTAPPVLGVPEGPYLAQATPEALEAFERQLQRLGRAGYTVLRVPALSDIEEVNARNGRIAAAEMAQTHARWFPYHAPLYQPITAALIREGRQADPARLEADRAGQLLLRAEIQRRMVNSGIDLWVCPAATGPAPEGIASTGNPIMNLPWTHAGLPAVSLPAGPAPNGLPLGLQCVGRFMADEWLLAWAEALHGALRELSQL